jgi:hypothetical protein
MAHKTLIGGTAYEIKGGNTLIDGTAYSIKSGKTLIDGTAYEIGFIRTLGGLRVGSSVYFNVGGVAQEFVVVHQGLPSSSYDASCSGTWLLMKDIYETRAWDTRSPWNNDYATSEIHSYLNNEFLSLFDAEIKNAIKQVKIPYTNGKGNEGAVAAGADGLPAKIFLLSVAELNRGLWSNDSKSSNLEGSALEYFNLTSSTIRDARKAYYNGSVVWWFSRSPYTTSGTIVQCVSTAGVLTTDSPAKIYGIRPCFVIPSEFILLT